MLTNMDFLSCYREIIHNPRVKKRSMMMTDFTGELSVGSAGFCYNKLLK